MKHKIFSYQLLNELPNKEVQLWDSRTYFPVSYSFNCILTRPVTHAETCEKSYVTYELNIKVREKMRKCKL